MKKWMSIIVVIMLMVATFFLMKEIFLYFANRPLNKPVVASVHIDESEHVLQFISKTHESYNGFLNYGKSDKYTEGDWKYLKQWFQSQETELKDIGKEAKNEKLKRDLQRSYEITKLGIDTNNIQYVVYGHRIYHDLDIIVNNYQKEQNIWGYTELGNGKDVKVVENELEKNKKN